MENEYQDIFGSDPTTESTVEDFDVDFSSPVMPLVVRPCRLPDDHTTEDGGHLFWAVLRGSEVLFISLSHTQARSWLRSKQPPITREAIVRGRL